jgi:hypothetical protein
MKYEMWEEEPIVTSRHVEKFIQCLKSINTIFTYVELKLSRFWW